METFGKLKVVYRNYGFKTHKLRKNYYGNEVCKALVDYLYSVIPFELTRRRYDNLAPYLDEISARDLEMIVELEKLGFLDDYITLVKEIARRTK